VAAAGIRARHPEYDDAQVHGALRRRRPSTCWRGRGWA